MARSRAKLSGTLISTSNTPRSTTLSTGALAATLARCATCTWPTWPSNGARSVSASTWRCISITTARWRSASRCLLRVSRPAPWPCSPCSLRALASARSAFFSVSCARATSICATAPPSNARWLRSRSRTAAWRSIVAWSSSLRALARIICASSAARSASASMPASVACSCARLLRSSGLSISASAWPFLTTSPATTLSVTVPPAMAYRVGLLAAMTRPSAAMSRTRSPRFTSAMRTREASNERLPALQPDTSQPATSTSPRPPAPSSSHCRRRRACGAARVTGRSWADVSRMLMRGSDAANAHGAYAITKA